MKCPKTKRLFGKTLTLTTNIKDYKDWEYCGEKGGLLSIIHHDRRWSAVLQSYCVWVMTPECPSERSCRNALRKGVKKALEDLKGLTTYKGSRK